MCNLAQVCPTQKIKYCSTMKETKTLKTDQYTWDTGRAFLVLGLMRNLCNRVLTFDKISRVLKKVCSCDLISIHQHDKSFPPLAKLSNRTSPELSSYSFSFSLSSSLHNKILFEHPEKTTKSISFTQLKGKCKSGNRVAMAGRYLQDLILDGKATSSQEQKVECVSSPNDGRTNEI